MATNIIWIAKNGRAGASGTENSPLNSIQEAVSRATPGTQIMVKAGLYTENLLIRRSGIELVSADGPGQAEIRPVDQSRDTVRVNAADKVNIDGFKIIGSERANAVHLSSVNDMTDLPTNIIIRNNDIRAATGDGIKVSQGDYISILNNRVTGSSDEEGIDFVGVHHGVISHNQVSGVGNSGPAIQVKGGSLDVDITYNKVFGNQMYGILAGGSTDEHLVRSVLSGKYEAQNVDIIGNEIYSNSRQAMRVVGADNVRINDNWYHNSASGRIVDVISSSGTHSAWRSGDVLFSNNSFDRSNWLTVDSGNPQPTLLSNRTDGAAPAAWSTFTAGITSGTTSSPSTPTSTTDSTSTTTASPTTDTSTSTVNKINGTWSADTLTGTTGADEIYGNGGNDVIKGKEGSDELYGGSGQDAFVFETGLGPSNVDRIGELNNADDAIYLENSVFSKLTATGTLSSSYLRIGDKALDSNDYIVYNMSTGAMYYDADGSGSGAAVQFAVLKAGLGITAADLFVI